MNVQKVLSAIALDVDSNGRVTGVSYVGAEDARVKAAVEQLKKVPVSDAQKVDAGSEFENVAAVVVQS